MSAENSAAVRIILYAYSILSAQEAAFVRHSIGVSAVAVPTDAPPAPPPTVPAGGAGAPQPASAALDVLDDRSAAQRVFDNPYTRGLLLGAFARRVVPKADDPADTEERVVCVTPGWFHHVGVWEDERNFFLRQAVQRIEGKIDSDMGYPDHHWFNDIFADIKATYDFKYFTAKDKRLANFIAYNTDADYNHDNESAAYDILRMLKAALAATISREQTVEVFADSDIIWISGNQFVVEKDEYVYDKAEIVDLPPESEDAEPSEDNPPRYIVTSVSNATYNFSSTFPYYAYVTTTHKFEYNKVWDEEEKRWTRDMDEDDEDYYGVDPRSVTLIRKTYANST